MPCSGCGGPFPQTGPQGSGGQDRYFRIDARDRVPLLGPNQNASVPSFRRMTSALSMRPYSDVTRCKARLMRRSVIRFRECKFKQQLGSVNKRQKGHKDERRKEEEENFFQIERMKAEKDKFTCNLRTSVCKFMYGREKMGEDGQKGKTSKEKRKRNQTINKRKRRIPSIVFVQFLFRFPLLSPSSSPLLSFALLCPALTEVHNFQEHTHL